MLAEGCKDYFSESFILQLLSLFYPTRPEPEGEERRRIKEGIKAQREHLLLLELKLGIPVPLDSFFVQEFPGRRRLKLRPIHQLRRELIEQLPIIVRVPSAKGRVSPQAQIRFYRVSLIRVFPLFLYILDLAGLCLFFQQSESEECFH